MSMEDTIDLAIVIPTLNEEKFIGKLLDSILNQTLWPKEIVVVDAYSKDNTIKEVIKRQRLFPKLKYYQIPKHTISRQRNFGARKTKAAHILFLDADSELKDPKTLEKYFDEVLRKKPDLAAATNLPISNFWKDIVYFASIDLLFKTAKPVWPVADGRNMYIKREVFEKNGGFDEDIVIGEDHEIVQRVVKKGGKFIFLDNPKIYNSARRFHKEGRRNFTLKMVRSFFHVLKNGYKNNPVEIEYKFGKFKSHAGK